MQAPTPEQPEGRRLTSGAAPGGGDPGVFMIIVVGIVASVVIIAMIICLRAMYEQTQQAEEGRKAADMMPPEIAAEISKQQEQANAYSWIDPKAGVVAIPVERAMELALAELNAGSSSRQPAKPHPAPADRSGARSTISK